MKARIKSVTQLNEKIAMAEGIQKLVKANTATEQNKDVYLVLMSEIREYVELKKIA